MDEEMGRRQKKVVQKNAVGVLFNMEIASRRRSILKTLSYRAIVTIILAVVTYVFTGNLYQTSTIAIVFGILATITYYLHERLWSRINWR